MKNTHIDVVVKSDYVRVTNVRRWQRWYVKLLIDELVTATGSNLGEFDLCQLTFLRLNDLPPAQILNGFQKDNLRMAHGDFAEVLNVSIDYYVLSRDIP